MPANWFDSVHVECLCGMLKIPRVPSWLSACIVRAQVPSSGEEIAPQNYMWSLISAYSATLKLIPALGECTRSAMVIINPQSL
ncbi:hypothetical protein TNCV_1499091 [Trichonephila clavipes]|nr:hypothetical protein TNCV_1499091 [Trichonephila clavipes]